MSWLTHPIPIAGDESIPTLRRMCTIALQPVGQRILNAVGGRHGGIGKPGHDIRNTMPGFRPGLDRQNIKIPDPGVAVLEAGG